MEPLVRRTWAPRVQTPALVLLDEGRSRLKFDSAEDRDEVLVILVELAAEDREEVLNVLLSAFKRRIPALRRGLCRDRAADCVNPSGGPRSLEDRLLDLDLEGG